GGDVAPIVRGQGKALAGLFVDVPHRREGGGPGVEARVEEAPLFFGQLELPGVRAHRHMDPAALAHGHVPPGILQAFGARTLANDRYGRAERQSAIGGSYVFWAVLRLVEEMNRSLLVGLRHDGLSATGDGYRRYLAGPVVRACRRRAG